MSRSLLIVICDFLLLSMLALAKFEGPEDEQTPPEPEPATTTSVSPEDEMVELLKASLEEEREARELLDAKLNDAVEALQVSQDELALREQRLEETKEELQERETEAKRMEAARQELEQSLLAKEQNLASIQEKHQAAQDQLSQLQKRQLLTQEELTGLANKYEKAQLTAEQLQDQLQQATSEARVSQQVLDTLQDDFRRQVALASELNSKVEALEETRENMETEKTVLANRLQVVEVEKRMTREQVENMRREVVQVREEKDRLEERATQLAEDVSELADSSKKLTQEVRDARPLPANAVFGQFQTNRVELDFEGTRKGVFGQTVRRQRHVETVLIAAGSQVFALFHIADTPLSLEPFPYEWGGLTGTIGRERVLYSITQVSFLNRDPRVVVVPIGAPQAAKLGCRIYPVAEDPSRFQEAVLIGATEGYYGECAFQLDPSTPHYVRMERERFRLFSGKFAPSRGDLVLSKSGELLGIMANSEYCLLMNDLTATRAIRTGAVIEQPAPLLTQLYHQLMALPSRLQ